ncbi:hypothetical protein [Streptomyces niveus]|uniref:hypothetical protein n=1 Tax=Streptomyces niveus TaxID=193462 RepID=UPI0013319AB5|nr:hypothetical protein [Streptomyces niveus]
MPERLHPGPGRHHVTARPQLGVGVFGTLFLAGLDGPGPVASGDALWICALALAGAAVLAAVAGPGRRRRTPDGKGPA